MEHQTGKADGCRILHLEDDPRDTEIVRGMLEDEKMVCVLRRVDTRADFEAELSKCAWDVILSDFALPSFDGLKALEIAQQKCPGVPFILFSGTIGEEMAIDSLKSGATDYVLKQRPARLIPAVRHALKEAEESRRRQQAEEELRKSEERKKQLEAQFLRVQRMENIGALAGGIAHDLNNALVPVLVGIGFLRLKPLDPDMEQMLSTMETSVRRGADMIKQVLTFARGAEGKETIVHVDTLIREMDRIVRNLFPKMIECRIHVPYGLWPVSGFATQIHQVLMNLCVNARDAMPRGGILTLSAENVRVDESAAQMHADAHPGQYLKLQVSDSGMGMTADVLEKIFQPFFTTKEPGKGTGLGLSTSYGIVKNHGGFMVVKSEPWKGTQFEIYLPVAKGAITAPSETKAPALPTGNGEVILVVDDEISICEITKATLENYGYKVLVATSGPEAVAIFADNRAKVQLALTDTSMPFMDGRATSQALRKINPNLKIIAASGEGDRNEEEEVALRPNVSAFIQKPYTMDKLLNTVHDVLTGKKRA